MIRGEPRDRLAYFLYKEWRKFENVINKAKESCKNSDISVLEHFVDVDKLSKRANNAEVVIEDYNLTRIRKTIKELGGTMPEDLPTPKKSLK